MTLANQVIHGVAKLATDEIDQNGYEKGIGYHGLVRVGNQWYPAEHAATADVLVSVSVDECGEYYRIFRRGFGTVVTDDFNEAELNLCAALGFV